MKPVSKRFAVLWISGFLAIPLWREFHEPNMLHWNVFLATFLISIVATVFFGMRYLEQNEIEVGEARFETSRRRSSDGS